MIDLPHDEAAERSLIASVLVAPKYFPHVEQEVSWRDFCDVPLGRLYETIRILHHDGKPVNDVTVLMPFLEQAGVPLEVRSAPFIARLMSEGRESNAVWYAKQVREASARRKLLGVAVDVQAMVSRHDDVMDVISATEQQLAEIERPQIAKLETIGQAAARVIEEIKANRLAKASRGTMCGLPSIDAGCGHMMPGEMTILAARPGLGKTSLAVQIAKHVAEQGRHVLIASLEMEGLELALRVLCGISKINSRLVRTDKISQGDEHKLTEAVKQIAELPVHIFAPHSATIDHIRTAAKLVMARNDLRLIIVDYIGLVTPADKREQRHEQVARISRSLKVLAKECNCPVLALCQLNREAETQRPRLSNLRESGAIEQDADVVMFLHRQDETRKDDITLYVEKHRHAERMMTNLRFVPAETRFIDPRGMAQAEQRQVQRDAFAEFNQGAF